MVRPKRALTIASVVTEARRLARTHGHPDTDLGMVFIAATEVAQLAILLQMREQGFAVSDGMLAQVREMPFLKPQVSRTTRRIEAEPTITPEQTLREAGIDDARQAKYQRRMSTLLAGRDHAASPRRAGRCDA